MRIKSILHHPSRAPRPLRARGARRKLELSPAPAAYKARRQRALDFLSRDKDGYARPDVRALLVWAEGRSEEVDDRSAQAGALEVGLREPVIPVAEVLYPAIRSILTDAVLQRSERCTSGLELWRRLFLEMRGASSQIACVQAERYQFPQRAPNIGALWDHLERWQALGAEVEGSGMEVPECMRSAALLKQVPKELETQIVARPELCSFTQRLVRVKAQLAHQRATTQAAALSGSRDDMVIGALAADDAGTEGEPMLDRLHLALEQLFQKGKGKGQPGTKGQLGSKGPPGSTPFRPAPGGGTGGQVGAGGGGLAGPLGTP